MIDMRFRDQTTFFHVYNPEVSEFVNALKSIYLQRGQGTAGGRMRRKREKEVRKKNKEAEGKKNRSKTERKKWKNMIHDS